MFVAGNLEAEGKADTHLVVHISPDAELLGIPFVFRSTRGVSTMTVTTKSLSLFGISGAGQVGRICVAVGMDIDNYRGGAHCPPWPAWLGLLCIGAAGVAFKT